MDWGTIAAAVAGSALSSAIVGGIVALVVNTSTSRLQQSTLEQQRLTANLSLMTDLMALGHGRDPGGRRDGVGLAEQLGAIESVAALGTSYEPLRLSATTYLETLIQVNNPAAIPTLEAALSTVRAHDQAQTALKRLRPSVSPQPPKD